MGRSASAVQVANVSPHGFWLLGGDRERFVSFAQFPWFRRATIGELSNVTLPSALHLYWPDLDIVASLIRRGWMERDADGNLFVDASAETAFAALTVERLIDLIETSDAVLSLLPDRQSAPASRRRQNLKKPGRTGPRDESIVVFTTDNGSMSACWPDGGVAPFRGEKATT